MRVAWLTLTIVAVVGLMSTGLQAHDEKDVTLKGTIMCARCALKESKTCQNVIKVKVKDKEVTYYFKDKGVKEPYHEEICGGERLEGTVLGTTSHTKDGKTRFIAPTKVTYTKKE